MGRNTSKPHKAPRIPAKEREYFVSNLAVMLNASVSVGQALHSLRESSSSRAMQRTLDQVMENIESGESLGSALRKSSLISPQTFALIVLGEKSGNLVPNLKLAASQEEKLRNLKSKIRAALMYPLFVLSTTVVIGLGVAWFLLPRLSETFMGLGIDLPLISQIMISAGLALKASGHWLIPACIVAIWLLIYILFIQAKTKRVGQFLLLHTPFISRVMIEVELVRFGYVLGTLLNAGLGITQAMRLLQSATGLYRYKKMYQDITAQIEAGYSIGDSLTNNKIARKSLPPTVRQIIITGESSGTLPQTLLDIGRVYEDKADTSTKNLEVALEPLLLIIVWLGVLGVAVAVIVPIYSLVGGLDAS